MRCTNQFFLYVGKRTAKDHLKGDIKMSNKSLVSPVYVYEVLACHFVGVTKNVLGVSFKMHMSDFFTCLKRMVYQGWVAGLSFFTFSMLIEALGTQALKLKKSDFHVPFKKMFFAFI